MIIDLHTNIWHDIDQLGPERAERLRSLQAERWGQFDASPAAHERALACIDAAFVLGFRSDRMDAHIPNEYIAEFVARDPRRRIGVAGIDPMCPDALDQLDNALALGLSGVAVSPASQGFHPAHSEAMLVYERCVANSIPLFVTHETPLTVASELQFARPSLWDEVARSFPDLHIVLGQLGHPWIDETLLLLGKHRRVWSEISGVASRPWQLYNALLSASSFRVMDKLLFGSGFPFETPEKTIESLYSVNAFSQGTQMPVIPRAQIRGIVERDAAECLGLEAVVPQQPPSAEEPASESDRPTTPATIQSEDDES